MTVLQRRRNLRSYRDDFPGSNSASLGANWRSDYAVPAAHKLDTQRADYPGMNINGQAVGGIWSSYQGGTDQGRLGSDNYEIRGQIVSPSGNHDSSQYSGFYVAAPDAFSQDTILSYAVFSVAGGSGIFTWQGTALPGGRPTTMTGATMRASNTGASGQAPLTSTLILRRANDVFSLYLNSYANLMVSWPDTLPVAKGSAATRRWGIINEGRRVSFGQEWRSPAFEWVTAEDLW